MAADGVTGLARYARLLRVPGAWVPVVIGTLARLPIGMTSLALLLVVQRETGSFAAAGAVTAAYSVALAVSAPVRGAAVDRRGGPAVLMRYGVAHPLALLGCLTAVLAGLPVPVVLALAAAAGGLFPPVGAVIRSLWAVLYDDDADRTTAYALDAVLIELAFITGPLVVGLAVAVASPVAALGFAAAAVGIGSVLLARSPVTARLVPHTGADRPSLRAPLSSGPVRWLLLALVVLGAGFGAIEVSVAGFAVEQRSDALVGPVLALWALGSVVGGLVYGARAWSATPERQYVWLTAMLAAGLALPLAATGPWTLALLLLAGGAAISPFSACNSALLAKDAPVGATAATFAWSGSCIVLGIAAGSGLAGWLVDHGGAVAGFGLGAAAGLMGLITAVRARTVRARAVRAAAA